METSNLWSFWVPNQPGISAIIWILVFVLLMYIARTPAHQVILDLAQGLRKALKIMAQSVSLAEQNLKIRNREVLMAHGQEETERVIDREFQRIGSIISRDLSGYPTLQRDLNEHITRIDEDYVSSGEVPPQPPEWIKAVNTIAKIPADGSPVVSSILKDIHGTLKKSLNKSVDEYRNANKERHGLLKKMMPHWRALSNTLISVEKKIVSLENRSTEIDNKMLHYEEIVKKTEYAERMLSSSSLTQFFISGFVLIIAIIGGYVNFQLVALPMSEMVGAASYIGSIRASDIAALFIIAIEVILGLFLMESVGITRLFPVISVLSDQKRKILMIVTFSFLLIFATIESSLAYMRDMLAADREALSQVLTGVVVGELKYRWIPSIGQMVMGFVLPFALTFVAIPLESFIHSSRTVLGIVMAWFLRVLSLTLRLLSTLIMGGGKFLVTIYDLFIFLPLQIEVMIRRRRPDNARV